ncbi:hypothetical protein T484DRAFT_1647298, partial [Baffinella frigidus]
PPTLNPNLETPNSQPPTTNPQPQALNPQPSTPNSTPSTPNPKPETFDSKPPTLNPNPHNFNSNPHPPNPKRWSPGTNSRKCIGPITLIPQYSALTPPNTEPYIHNHTLCTQHSQPPNHLCLALSLSLFFSGSTLDHKPQSLNPTPVIPKPHSKIPET